MLLQKDIEDIAHAMPLLWDPLSDEQRELFADNVVIKKAERDEELFLEGSFPHHLYYLLRGKVTMYRTGLAGQRQIVRMVEPGAPFGFMDACEGMTHSSNAVAGADTVVAIMPMNLIFHLICENGSFAMFFIKELASLLNISMQRTMNLTQKHIRGRLADTLIRMKEKYGLEEDGQTLTIYLSREDLGQMSNMTTSNAIRTLSAFAADGIIATVGKKIMILKEQELRRVAQMG